MTAASSLISELRGSLAEESARIALDFAAAGDGRAAVARRTRLLEDILKRLWQDLVSPEEAGPGDFALVATGGFGRGWLFPYSDVDLLFLYADRRAEEAPQRGDRAVLAGVVGSKAQVEPGVADAGGVRSLRSEQYRIHHLSSGLPLSRRRPRAVRAAARQSNPQARNAGSEATAARAGRGHAGTTWKIRADRVSSGAEFKRDAGRVAGLQRGLLAGADLRHGHVGRLAAREFAAGAGAKATGCGAGIPDGDAVFSAFPPWA